MTILDTQPPLLEDNFAELFTNITEIKDKISLLLTETQKLASYESTDDKSQITKIIPSSPIERARSIYYHRRRRDEVFGHNLFGDPAWDFLLDLFIYNESKKLISVDIACLAAKVPEPSGQRWLDFLEAKNFIYYDYNQNEKDVRLTPSAWQMMNEFLQGL